MLLIISHLGTAIWMRKRNHFLYASFYISICSPRNRTGHIIHTANRRYHPDFISHTNFTVWALKALKKNFFSLRIMGTYRLISIVQQIAQTCFDIVGMYPITLFDVFLCISNWAAILDDRFSLTDVAKCDLMACRNFLKCSQLFVSRLYPFSRRDRIDCNCHIIIFVYFQNCHD